MARSSHVVPQLWDRSRPPGRGGSESGTPRQKLRIPLPCFCPSSCQPSFDLRPNARLREDRGRGGFARPGRDGMSPALQLFRLAERSGRRVDELCTRYPQGKTRTIVGTAPKSGFVFPRATATELTPCTDRTALRPGEGFPGIGPLQRVGGRCVATTFLLNTYAVFGFCSAESRRVSRPCPTGSARCKTCSGEPAAAGLSHYICATRAPAL